MGSMCTQDTRPDSELTESERNGRAIINGLIAAEITLKENGVNVEDLVRQAGHQLAEGAILLAAKMCEDAKVLMTQAVDHAVNDPSAQQFIGQVKDGLMNEGQNLLKETLMKQGQAQIQQAIMAGLMSESDTGMKAAFKQIRYDP